MGVYWALENLRNGNTPEAIETLEKHLDSNILELGSLLTRVPLSDRDNLPTGTFNFPNTLHDSIQAALAYQYTSPIVVAPVSPTLNIEVNTPILNLPRP
jgi:hypothetical protein